MALEVVDGPSAAEDAGSVYSAGGLRGSSLMGDSSSGTSSSSRLLLLCGQEEGGQAASQSLD